MDSLFHSYYFIQTVFSIGITLVNVHMNRLNWLCFLILMEGPPVIVIDWMIFLSPFLDVIRISMSAVSGLLLFLILFWKSYRNRCRLYGHTAVYIHSTCWETSSICCYSGRPSYSIIDGMIFQSPFLDVKRMFMSTVFRLVLVVNW